MAILAERRRCAGACDQQILSCLIAGMTVGTIDYREGLLQHTPAGRPAERHVTAAPVRAARIRLQAPAVSCAGVLGTVPGKTASIVPESSRLNAPVSHQAEERWWREPYPARARDAPFSAGTAPSDSFG